MGPIDPARLHLLVHPVRLFVRKRRRALGMTHTPVNHCQQEQVQWSGAAYYRTREYEEALRWLGNSLERGWDMARPLNLFLLAMIHRQYAVMRERGGKGEESNRVYEEMESRRVDGAVPGVFAADWMTIQIYRREVGSLFTSP